jgi:2-succinyl-6-hydroxy-2,4-cyclohexadiene-1-carboxylate synthase
VSTEASTSAATSTTLCAEVRGSGPRVVLLHGFAQNHRCLGPLVDAVSAGHTLVLPDAPGHGGSLTHHDADVARAADLLTSTGGAAVYVGYSMGGRTCLQAAVDHPDRVRALVLIGATAGIEDPDERAARRAADHAWAERLEAIGVDAFVQEWLSAEMFAGLPDWARFEEERRTNVVEGLAGSLRSAGTGSMAPMWDRLGELQMPVLCITGSLDERYGTLARRLVDDIGAGARHVEVDGAGHAAHLERPDEVSDAVVDFLASLPVLSSERQAETNSPSASSPP